MTALLPAGPVPVPALAQPGGQRGPGHQVRRAGRDFLIASGATIALHRGGARHEPDHPVLAVPRLLDRRAESRGGVPGTSGGRAATAPARAATAGPAASSAREIVRQAAGLARAHGSHSPDPPGWTARPAVAWSASNAAGAKAGSPYRADIDASTAGRISMPATLQLAAGRLVTAQRSAQAGLALLIRGGRPPEAEQLPGLLIPAVVLRLQTANAWSA
jgi:hypothetical protein